MKCFICWLMRGMKVTVQKKCKFLCNDRYLFLADFFSCSRHQCLIIYLKWLVYWYPKSILIKLLFYVYELSIDDLIRQSVHVSFDFEYKYMYMYIHFAEGYWLSSLCFFYLKKLILTVQQVLAQYHKVVHGY